MGAPLLLRTRRRGLPAPSPGASREAGSRAAGATAAARPGCFTWNILPLGAWSVTLSPSCVTCCVTRLAAGHSDPCARPAASPPSRRRRGRALPQVGHKPRPMARTGPVSHPPRPSCSEKPQVVENARPADAPNWPFGVPQGAVCDQLAGGAPPDRPPEGPDAAPPASPARPAQPPFRRVCAPRAFSGAPERPARTRPPSPNPLANGKAASARVARPLGPTPIPAPSPVQSGLGSASGGELRRIRGKARELGRGPPPPPPALRLRALPPPVRVLAAPRATQFCVESAPAQPVPCPHRATARRWTRETGEPWKGTQRAAP